MAETGARSGIRALALLFVAIAAFVAWPANSDAAYVHKYGTSFNLSPAAVPAGIAVDKQSGSVYVLTTEGVLEKFDASGNTSNFSSSASNAISVPCEFECRGIAVDNSGGENQGVIYVAGAVTGGEPRQVNVYLPSGVAAKPITNSSATERRLCGVAVDSLGRVYVTSLGFDNIIDRYSPASWASNPTSGISAHCCVRRTRVASLPGARASQ